LEGGQAHQTGLAEGQAHCHPTDCCGHLGVPSEAKAHPHQIPNVVLGLTHHATHGSCLGTTVEVTFKWEKVFQAMFSPNCTKSLCE